VAKLTVRLAALLLLWALFPGAGEVTENLVHLSLHGHTAHAAGHADDHAKPGAEHGCTGPFHVCSCHTSTPFELTRAAKLPSLRSTLAELAAPPLHLLARPHPPLDRPPSA
jgi:hypothetical protein